MRNIILGLLICGGMFSSSAASRGSTQYIIGSVARLRSAAAPGAPVLTTLRIGTPVRVLEQKERWAKVQAWVDGVEAQPARGYVRRHLLSARRPTREALLGRADAAQTLAARRRWLERATALYPEDEAIIERLIATLAETRDEKAHHMAKKGLVAAKKRNASWDGPLYPLDRRLVELPRPCEAGDPRVASPLTPAAHTALTREALPNDDLRARAFAIVDSGKVVSVTTRGYQTQLLDRRVCVRDACGDHLGYHLPRPAPRGALVPSWMVAGHRVTGYPPNPKALPRFAQKFACGGCRTFVDDSERSVLFMNGNRQFRLAIRTLDGARVTDWTPSGAQTDDARPIARFDEQARTWRILFRESVPEAACAPRVEVWLARLTWDESGTPGPIELGRRFANRPAPHATSDPSQR